MWKLDIYETFFAISCTSVISVILYAMALIMLKDSILLFLIASLMVVAAMMNLGENTSSAKEVFWAWILFDIMFALLSLYGGLLVWIF